MNKITLIGNLTRDPELSQTHSGVSVCKFGIAVSRSFTNLNGERETDFFEVAAWRGLGENCAKYLEKGKKVCIVGNMQTGEYTDRDGIKRRTWTVVAEDVEFLSYKEKDPSEEVPKPKAKEPQQTRMQFQSSTRKSYGELRPVDNEDLPF